MNFDKEMFATANNIICELANHYELRKDFNNDELYCKTIYNLTVNFLNTALLTSKCFYGLPSQKTDLYSMFIRVSEMAAKIAEMNVIQIKEGLKKEGKNNG